MNNSKKKKNVLMIVDNCFPGDIRVKKEAYHLKKQYKITVIALRTKPEDRLFEKLDDITIIRLPLIPDIKLGKLMHILDHFYITFLSSIIFLLSFPIKRYKVIHTHNPPDTLFMVGLAGKIFGIKYIFDHHDLTPNLYTARFAKKDDIVYKVMILCEKFSCKLADAIIATNESYKRIEIDRHNVNQNKIFIVRNNPIIEDCQINVDKKNDNNCIENNSKIVLLFIGSINPQDGVDILLQSLHFLINTLGEKDFICNIVGAGDSLPEAQQIARKLNLEDYVNFTGRIHNREKIKEHFHAADIGVEPAPYNDLNAHSTFIKIMEYMAAGIPSVAFDLKETRFSSDGSSLLIKPNDVEAFAKGIQRLIHDKELREKMGRTGLKRVTNELSWLNATKNLDEAYRSLFNQ